MPERQAASSLPGAPSERLHDQLLALRGETGGWRAAAGSPETVEATVLGLAAVEALGREDEEVTGPARQWLLAAQSEDGSFPVAPAIPVPSWSTAMAGLYLWDRDETRPAARRAFEWLLRTEGVRPGLVDRVRLWINGPGAVEVDPYIVGWSWRVDTFSWVEPTAWAALLLRKALGPRPSQAVTERLSEVRALYADRECVGGGWNYGNRAVFDTPLPANPDTTAIALISAQGWTDEPWVGRGLAALDRMMEDVTSPLAYSLSRLAKRLHGRLPTGPSAASYQADNGLLVQTRNLAMALLADHVHPLLELGSGRALTTSGAP